MSTTTFLSLAGAAAVLAAGTAHAQTATGASCPGFSGTTPGITNQGLAVFGDTWDLELTGLPGGFGYLAIGFSDTFSTVLLSPLPIDFGVLFSDPAWGGCDLNVDFNYDLVPILLDGTGAATLTFPGFHAPAKAYFQFVALDADFVGFTKIPGVSTGWCMEGREPSGVLPGDLVVTEIMKDPSFAFDADGEWFEILNTTAGPIDIDGFVVADDGSDSHTISNGGPLLVPAGGYVVLGVNGSCTANGGVALDYDYGTTASFNLSNGDDEIVLLDPNLKVIDRVAYDNGVTFPDVEGVSMALDVTKLNDVDNDDGANWSTSTCPLGVGCGLIYNADTGTPGAANDTCSTPPPPVPTGDVIFVEVMKDPDQASDDAGEWFEVFNTTASAIDLDGYTFSAGLQTFTVSGTLVVPASGHQLFMRDVDALDNGGIDGAGLGAYEYDPNLGMLWNMGNGDETLRVFDAVGTLVGELAYDNGVTFPDTSGVAMGLDPMVAYTQANAAIGANWCNQTSTVPGGTDLGTPGSPNDLCAGPGGGDTANPGDVIVTEIMQNPAAVGDTAGEWFEIYNTTGSDIDIEGWTFSDLGSNSFTVSNGGPLVLPAGGFLVLGINADSGSNGGVAVDYQYPSAFTLGNGDDEIVIQDVASTEISRVEYDGGPVWPDPNGASMNLDANSFDATSANDGTKWCPTSAANTLPGGDTGTPGAANEVCP
ncbi:MAG: lamin tail domain-containing protein [Planctomycetota bacterium]